MERTDVVVVGAGPGGLAMSRCLSSASIDHVVLERGGVANSWRCERWDSLRTLTPNWMNRLPDQFDPGDDPDGYLPAALLADHLTRYATDIAAPVLTATTVLAVRTDGVARPSSRRWCVDTDRGPWRCRAVVIATGASGRPHLPPVAEALPAGVRQLDALHYRRPDDTGSGAVLVVGASASGTQIADELARSGRDVTIAVGEHVRLPRTYRGRDIYRWMTTVGLADERWTAVADLARARRIPSPQLAPERACDLNALQSAGVAVVGRLVGVNGGRLQFAGSLANLVANADLKQQRLLERIDAFARATGLDDLPADRPPPTTIGRPPTELTTARFEAIVWATGHRPSLPQLDDRLYDRRGNVSHDGGVLTAPGLYVLGLPFLRRRTSSFIAGVAADAAELAPHVRAHLDRTIAA